MKSLYKCDDCEMEDAIVKDGGIFFCMSCWFKQDNKIHYTSNAEKGLKK